MPSNPAPLLWSIVLGGPGLLCLVLWLDLRRQERLRGLASLPPRTPARRLMGQMLSLALMLLLTCALALALSGCGTAPSPAPAPLQVPATLLTPPQKPVLLMPVLPSTPPLPTTPKTPRPAPSTGYGTSA